MAVCAEIARHGRRGGRDTAGNIRSRRAQRTGPCRRRREDEAAEAEVDEETPSPARQRQLLRAHWSPTMVRTRSVRSE